MKAALHRKPSLNPPEKAHRSQHHESKISMNSTTPTNSSSVEQPHPLAEDLKPLFLDLYCILLPNSTSTSAASTPSLTHTATTFSSAESLGAREILAPVPRRLNACAAEFLPRENRQEVDSGNYDMLAGTSLNIAYSPVKVSQSSTSFTDRYNGDWYGYLRRGVESGGRDKSLASSLINTKLNWNLEDLHALTRELIWQAVTPMCSAVLRVKDIRRVVDFAIDMCNYFFQFLGQETGALFCGFLVENSIGLFLSAWSIPPTHGLFYEDVRHLHVQMSIRLSAFIADLYAVGFMQHLHFHQCIDSIMKRVHTYEAVVAVRVMVEIIGDGNSIFWKLQAANHLDPGAYATCTVMCAAECLRSKGMLTNVRFVAGAVDSVKEDFAKVFLENIMEARLPLLHGKFSDGLHSSALGAVTARVVNEEIWGMFVRLGLRSPKKM
ncbi:hypothetical protein VNI00_003563 [Paramarasmius palmivorus]|uniref:Uncharacterized protein n=1 Tax=Paramarasmius palmivorus TaxID=297713 RepID=A0AAW0DRQ7_9AGAR